MYRYLVPMAVLALMAGSLFRAAEQTGLRMMAMFGTLGLALVGIIGTMVISRVQSRAGRRQLESALKALEPNCIITDWTGQRDRRPDYAVVTPNGVVALCVDETPQSALPSLAAARVNLAQNRARAAAHWVEDRLAMEVPVWPAVVLTRRRVRPKQSIHEVAVLNTELLTSWIGALPAPGHLKEPDRIRITRILRQGRDEKTIRHRFIVG